LKDTNDDRRIYMWIFTDTGFVSAVRKPWAKDKMTVRARDKQSLAELSEISGEAIVTSKDSDYPHRVVVDDKVFKGWLVENIDKMSYDNFKTQVGKTRGKKFASLLSQVWYVMLGAEDIERKDEEDWELDYNEWKAHQ
jgi:hypothetical protein